MSAQLSIASTASKQIAPKQTESKGFNPETATLAQLKAAVNRRSANVKKGRELDQELLICAAIFWLKHTNPEAASIVFSGFSELSGSMRVDNMAAWMRRVGLQISENDGQLSFRKQKSFDFTPGPAAILKQARTCSYWNMPKGETKVKIPDSIPATTGIAVQFARYVSFTGDIAGAKKALIHLIESEIMEAAKTPKVKEYVAKAKAQQAQLPKSEKAANDPAVVKAWKVV